jgi:osmoprotectant transport system permease protein
VLRPPVTAAAEDPWVRWDWVVDHRDDIQQRLVEHVELVGIALVVGLAIAVPLGIAVWRWRSLYPPVLAVMGVVYSIPSLALLAFLVPWTGLTTTTSEIMLVGYTLLILVRNTVAGLDSVPAEVQEAARGMGYSANRQLLRDFRTPIVVGSALAVALAVAIDLSLAGLQRLLMPWDRRRS